MPVIAGLAVGEERAEPGGRRGVIEHLLKPQTQVATAAEVGFFPVVKAELPRTSTRASRCCRTPSPRRKGRRTRWSRSCRSGLADKGGEFNKVYMDTFQRIVLRNEPVRPCWTISQGARRPDEGDRRALLGP
jgi:multiple sugar transport system substrate-binding protein